MARDKRLSPNRLAEEEGYFNNLKNIAGYQPLKPEYEISAIQAVIDTIRTALAEESQFLARLKRNP